MKLLALKINKRGEAGWESERIPFGLHVTQVSGENGSGKTPVIQAIVYCLGYPVTFRDDVKAKCKSVSLWVEVEGREYLLTREIDRDFQLTITSSESNHFFEDERQFSTFFFSLLCLDPVNLLDTSGRKTTPYMATLLPLFFLDQDVGYSDVYKPVGSFIKDQFQEMVRYIFRFSQRNLFESAKDLIQLKSQRGALDEVIASHRSVLERMNANRPSNRSEDEMLSQISERKERLQQLRSSQGSRSEATSVFDVVIYEADKTVAAINNELADLKLRVTSFLTIKGEIETEINTLSLNERAKRVFESIGTICANSDCGLFQTSRESYGKSLLYLKDQVKDLELSATAARDRMQVLEGAKGASQIHLDSLKIKREEALTSEVLSALVDAVKEATESVLLLEQELSLVQQIKAVTMRLYEASEERGRLSDKIDSIDTHGRKTDQNMLGLRVQLRDLTLKWLDILGTENVDRNVFIENDLKFTFGSESLRAFKGSTLVRVVLAIHAALFEAYLSRPGVKFSSLIFDTPNQQEILVDDLHRFMQELKKLCVTYDAQVVFASKDYHYKADDEMDFRVTPMFPGDKHPMYLG